MRAGRGVLNNRATRYIYTYIYIYIYTQTFKWQDSRFRLSILMILELKYHLFVPRADIDAGVYAGIVLASADGVAGADKPPTTTTTTTTAAAFNKSSSTSQLTGTITTSSSAVKPTTTSGSSSRRRLTSLSLRSAGYINDGDVDVPSSSTKGSGPLHLSSKIPTPGSTIHTRSTSSFSSWSVGSLNAPREVRAH